MTFRIYLDTLVTTSIRELKYLETGAKQVPFFDWYERIRDEQARLIIASRLRLLQNPDFKNYKAVGPGIFELRIFLGPGYRVYFAFENKNVVAIICGGDKKSQPKDIKKAVRLWKEHRNATKRI